MNLATSTRYSVQDPDSAMVKADMSPTSPSMDRHLGTTTWTDSDCFPGLRYPTDTQVNGSTYDFMAMPNENSGGFPDWGSTPSLSASGSGPDSPAFDNCFTLQDGENADNGFISPSVLTDDSWAANARKQSLTTEESYLSPKKESPPASPELNERRSKLFKSKPSSKAKSKFAEPRARSSKFKSSSRTATRSSAGSNGVSLRTASRKASQSSTSSALSPASPESGPLTADERRARQSHNVVEKQYRNRLNAQFELLLSVLPTEYVQNGEDRRLSKAEVLDLARRRIISLEQERRQLRLERQALIDDISLLQAAHERRCLSVMV